VHPDHLDRPTKMTNASQAVVWDAYYWPYGEVRSITGSASNNLRFPGQYFLVESGLHYNWHRHYDPTIGRYIQPDPNRDVLATQPVNLDGSKLTASGGVSGGSRLALSVASAGDFNRQIGSALPEFVDGPSVYAYARSAPSLNVDPFGLWTVNVGLAGSLNLPIFGPVGFGGTGFGDIVFDGSKLAWYYGGGGGLGGGVGSAFGIQFGGSNANSVCDLRGPFSFASASGGEGIVVGGEKYSGSGSHGQSVTGGNFFVGGGGGTPVSGMAGVTGTAVNPWW
jgi:RHS repeat-associated protein